MKRGSFFYGLYSLGVLGLYMTASSFGYSPFADGGRSTFIGGFYGPTHK